MSLADTDNENFVRVRYQMDDGTVVQKRVKQYRATAGGFEVGDAPGPAPLGLKMREIHFKQEGTGRRSSVPWATIDAQWMDTTLTISIDGTPNWHATGRTGEQFTYY